MICVFSFLVCYSGTFYMLHMLLLFFSYAFFFSFFYYNAFFLSYLYTFLPQKKL